MKLGSSSSCPYPERSRKKLPGSQGCFCWPIWTSDAISLGMFQPATPRKQEGVSLVSSGVSPLGVVASQCPIKGDLVESADINPVLTIGVFDGIGSLRVAADALGWNVHVLKE